MDVSYFEFLVLLLGSVVFVLAALVYYFARKEKRSRDRTKKLIQSYFNERVREQGIMKKELANLKGLLESNSIDRGTYERMKKVLKNRHEKKRSDTNDLIDYVKKKK